MVGIDRRCQGPTHSPSNSGNHDFRQDNSGECWYGGHFRVVCWCVRHFFDPNPRWPDLPTERENEVRRKVLEAAQAGDRGGEGNEDNMQVDGQQMLQDVGTSRSSLQCTANGGGLFLSPKMKGR